VAGAASAQPSGPTLTGPTAYGDYTTDKPGIVRKIGPGDLPAPNPAESVPRFPQVAPRPATAQLQTLPGFTVTEYSNKLTGPRTLRSAPNGDVFVAESTSGRVKVLRPGADGAAPTIETFAEGLAGPFGIAFYPAANPQWVYVAETNAVKRYPYRAGEMKAAGPAEVIVDKLAETGGGHVTRDVAFTRDGRRMLVSIGSQSNFAQGQVPAKSPAEVAAFEGEHSRPRERIANPSPPASATVSVCNRTPPRATSTARSTNATGWATTWFRTT
jgi:glucose/arabinose dehydrogenase